MTGSEKFELNFNNKFGWVVLLIISTSRKKCGITCATPYSDSRVRNHPGTSTYPVPVEKSYISSCLAFSKRLNTPLIISLNLQNTNKNETSNWNCWPIKNKFHRTNFTRYFTNFHNFLKCTREHWVSEITEFIFD